MPRKRRQARPCSARRTDGGECGNYAITGGTVCHAHGGRARQVKAAAARRVAEGRALATWAEFAPPTNGDHAEPVDVLAELEQLTAVVTAFHRFTESRLRELSAADWLLADPVAVAALGMWQDAADRAAKLLVALAGLGLDARREEAAYRAEVKTERLLDMLSATIDEALRGLGHDPADPAVHEVVDRALSRWNVPERE